MAAIQDAWDEFSEIYSDRIERGKAAEEIRGLMRACFFAGVMATTKMIGKYAEQFGEGEEDLRLILRDAGRFVADEKRELSDGEEA